MEDAPEDDRDIKLQKVSGDLIEDFDCSIVTFLRKPDGKLRNRVRNRETTRLTSHLLDPFQELPQLLDPHLPKWLPLLAAAYLEHLYTQSHRRTNPSEASSLSARAQFLEPLPFAICKLLYTFCKIRGQAVVVRFLPVETRHLEPLLSAIESADRKASKPSLIAVTDPSRAKALASEPSQRDWHWEERYIVLLWMSHLLLAPFDLSTISSAEPDDDAVSPAANLTLSEGVPGITLRLLPLGIKYLASPGKERDGAKELLVRTAMRRDMQQLGILDSLVQWALASLKPKEGEESEQPYLYIGVLAFLAGVLRSSVNTSDMDKHLPAIFEATYAVSSQENAVSKTIQSYAVARKMIIKVIRSVSILILRQTPPSMAGTEIVESSISYLLECLADNDTPVRFAASKALSVITLKLEPDMAEQVVDAVLDALSRNVLWTKTPAAVSGDAKRTRDLSAVDQLEWHGLMLTLSHLLYRRSPPARQLADIAQGLLLGLSFEKRSTSGGSIGSNVRDAANFGIWALARRYTTEELLKVPTEPIKAASTHPEGASLLQILANELVVTASLDSAGNIRRGASAALQELIGRHPDTVQEGIWVVQTVDYHAVALRSRAIQQVALNTTKLADQYGHALLDALLGWRGIGDPDAIARRVAAQSYGALTLQLARGCVSPVEQFEASVRMIRDSLATLRPRQVEERHGLLLSLASIFDRFPKLLVSHQGVDGKADVSAKFRPSLQVVESILHDAAYTTYRRPELISESSNKLIIALLPILYAESIHVNESCLADSCLQPGYWTASPVNTDGLVRMISALDALPEIPEHVYGVVAKFEPVITGGLGRAESEIISAASGAALVLLAFSSPAERERIIKKWADTIRHRPTSKTTQSTGYFFALTAAHAVAGMSQFSGGAEDDIAAEAMLERWSQDDDVDTRVAILKSLTQSVVLRDRPLAFLGILAEGLNDYTTNAQGDVGSHVRLEALRATKGIWTTLEEKEGQDSEKVREALTKLLLRVLRLAAEKLDRVRTEAHSVLALTMTSSFASRFTKLTFSSRAYFQTLLSLHTTEIGDCLKPAIADMAAVDPSAWMSELLAGYVTSADTGNEDLVIASRAALTTFCTQTTENLESVCTALVHNLTSARAAPDRVVVPTLEIIAFLCQLNMFQASETVNTRKLCLLVQKAAYKTGNVRKLEACIHVYGCLASFREDEVFVLGDEELTEKRREGVSEAKKRLGALMFHPWPRVRSLVVDELWRLFCVDGEGASGDDERGARLKSVDWGRADKGAIRSVVSDLGLS